MFTRGPVFLHFGREGGYASMECTLLQGLLRRAVAICACTHVRFNFEGYVVIARLRLDYTRIF